MTNACIWAGCKETSESWGCATHRSLVPKSFREQLDRSFAKYDAIDAQPWGFQKVRYELEAWVRKTFAADVREPDPGRWARLVRYVRARDAARALERQQIKEAEAAQRKFRHLKLVP